MDDVLGTRPWLLLLGDKGHHVGRRHLDGVFGDDGEERLQIVRIGAHRVRPGSPGCELQEGVDQLMTELISIAATLTGDALQLRRPDHGNPPLSEPPPGEILPGRSAELADHPYKWITRISAVQGQAISESQVLRPRSLPSPFPAGADSPAVLLRGPCQPSPIPSIGAAVHAWRWIRTWDTCAQGEPWSGNPLRLPLWGR